MLTKNWNFKSGTLFIFLLLVAFLGTTNAQPHVFKDIAHKHDDDDDEYGYSPRKPYHKEKRAIVVNYQGKRYKLERDVFYVVPTERRAFQTEAPIGLEIPRIPRYSYVIPTEETDLYYFNGTFLVQKSNGMYIVVPPPLGTVVDRLPRNYHLFEIDGRVYYVSGSIYYKEIRHHRRGAKFKVVRKENR